jgi:hypothetical protein
MRRKRAGRRSDEHRQEQRGENSDDEAGKPESLAREHREVDPKRRSEVILHGVFSSGSSVFL